MKILYLIFRQIFNTERFYLTQEIVIQIVAVNQVVVITDNTNLADDIHLYA